MKPWEKYQSSESAKPWEKYAQGVPDVPHETSDISPLESAARGAGQTATAGFQDEASAGLEKGLIKIHNLFSDGKIDEPTYQDLRSTFRQKNVDAEKANPKSFAAGGVAGAIPLTIATGGEGLAANVASGALQGGATALGSSDADLTKGEFGQAAKDTALGIGLGAAGSAVGEGLGLVAKKATPLIGKVSKSLGAKAEKLALNATGATGRQSEKFADNAGRELLDRKLVRFGDNAENIADRTGDVLDQSQGKISNSLKDLDAQGGKVDKIQVLKEMQGQIDDLRSDPSQAGVRRKLESIRDDIKASGPSEELPQTSQSLSEAENTKRGFQRLSNYNDPEAHQASKTAAGIYQKSVEKNALELNDKIAGEFTQGKKDYGLFAPINEASERRAATLNQSPWGGLLDVAAVGAGATAFGTGNDKTGAGLLSAVALRHGRPRLSSAAAVTTDLLSKNIGKLGKYAPAIQKALQRGPQAAAATHFVLSQTQPDYRQATQNLDERDDQNGNQ